MYKSLPLYFFAFFMAFLSADQLSAQSTKPPQELGLQFSKLDLNGGSGFTVFLKKQKKENLYRRLHFFAGNLLIETVHDHFRYELAFGIGIGREKRKPIRPNLEWYQGPEFSLVLNIASFLENESQITFTPGIGWVFGLQQHLNDRWALNLEVLPNMNISLYGNTNDQQSRSIQFQSGLSNSVSIGLLRKF